MSSKTSLDAVDRLASSGSPSLLDRLDSFHPQLTEAQALVDGIVSHSIEEITKPETMIALLGAGGVSRLTRIGVMSAVPLQEGKIFLPLLAKGGSYALALANESAAFAGIERGFGHLEGHPSSESFERAWARSAISLGSLKFFGKITEGQNIVLQHLSSDLGLVGAQQLGQALQITDAPHGTLAEQMLQAEAMNWNMKGSMALLHGLSPNLLPMEKSLDLYLRNQETESFSRWRSSPFFSQIAMATEGGPHIQRGEPQTPAKVKGQDSPLQREHKPLLMADHSDAAGGGGREGREEKIPLPLEIVPSDHLVVGEKPTLVLVTMIPDDSGSISSYGNAPAIRRGHNGQLDDYQNNPNNILVKTRYLNGHILFDYSKPNEAVRMNERNYNPQLGTPLYNESYKALEEVEDHVRRFADRFNVFAMSCIMTDGANTATGKEPQDVKAVVERMLASGRHIIAGIGVRDGHTDFHQVFLSMGIPEQWIKVLERAERDIVQGMAHFAHTTRTVGDARSFKHTSMGGFTGRATGAVPQQPGWKPVNPDVSAAAPAQGPFPATATPGKTIIGQMMGVPKEGPRIFTQVDQPNNLPWKPDPKKTAKGQVAQWGEIKAPEWIWEDGRWVFRMPADKTETVIGRQGDTLIVDPRNPSYVSRFHAKIRRIPGDEGPAYAIVALKGDVSLDRGGQPIYVQGSRSTDKEGESTWLLPGDKILLAPDVSFIFRP